MCFSAQADLVGGTVVALLGVDALRHVRQRREIAIAAMPLLLGAHQLFETFVWWGLQGHVASQVGEVAIWIYLLIAFVLLPSYVPFAIWRIEATAARRRLMVPFMLLGIAVSAVLLLAMVGGPVSASLESQHIAYDIGLQYGGVIVVAYVTATCGSMLMSGYRYIVAFGCVNLPVVVVLAALAQSGFASLWCMWAAVTSGMIALHLRYQPRHGHQFSAPPVPIAS
ncbi:MAG: DUF6629 family protein [Ilumatobacteraceae bacterium]